MKKTIPKEIENLRAIWYIFPDSEDVFRRLINSVPIPFVHVEDVTDFDSLSSLRKQDTDQFSWFEPRKKGHPSLLVPTRSVVVRALVRPTEQHGRGREEKELRRGGGKCR